jgi:transposase
MKDGIDELIELVPILKNARMELKLIHYREYIVNARERRRYTYQKIAKKLKENGVTVSTKTLQRFIRRTNEETKNLHQ